ncbi:MFS transporter [Methylocella tundrae]|uniref:Major facilitator transporter n=1 Tax=Methylocella tundrae TaxID=227605 RepID=A0A4U8Z3U1_METTU|nr:MFS transporter [Methylocella tundrae]WPP03923.1 MFS transporter [Methylocella tundrae]VFU10135.1 Major facilitator transporter [Methylocella tundrae]
MKIPAHQHGGSPVILGAVCLAALILPLSFSGGAAATPAIGRELHGSPEALTWITNAFMLTFGSLLMAAGALADRYGRKRIFTIGVALFVLFSLALSVAPSLWVVDLLRAAQGVGAAAALAGGAAALAQEFDGHDRTRAFSLLGTTFGVGLAFGPLTAGLLIETAGWRSVFLTSSLVGALALFFGVPRMRETRDPDAATLDWPGTLSFTGMLALFTIGVIEAPARGWTDGATMGLLAGAAVLLAVFVCIEIHAVRPMLDLSLFRYPQFVGVQILPIATCACFVVLLVILPLRFIGIEGQSAVGAGLMMMALAGPMLVVPMAAAALTHRFSAHVISGAGLIIAAVGLVWLGTVDLNAGLAVLPPMLLIGIGTGLPWGLMDALSVSIVPRERAGMATGIFGTVRVAGEGVALAIVSAALTGLIGRALALSQAASMPSVPQASQRLAVGDMMGAVALVPGMDAPSLIRAYEAAFQTLTNILAAVTILCAITILWLLARAPTSEADALPKTRCLDSNGR